MAAAWATAFLAAAVLAVIGTPLVRRLAVASEFLDRPVNRKGHATPVPYLGGVAIIVGATVGLLAGSGIAPRIAVVSFGACVMGAVGLLDDRRNLSASARLVAQFGVACGALVVGISLHATRITVIDWALTVVWIIGVTNAFNLMDNMDGLAAGVAAAASVAVFALAALGGQVIVASLAAATTGACLGFLAYNIRPATIFMGDAGSLFLGFLLAIGSIELDPAPRPPISFAVPLILLALPLLDTATVSLARMRHGLAVTQGGRDHLSHRLVARGLTPGHAVSVLVAVEVAFGAVAVALGRGLVSLPWAVSAAGALLLAVVASTARVRVYDIAARGLPHRLWFAAAAAVAIVLLAATPATIALWRARAPLTASASAARAALTAASQGHRDTAARDFAEAEHGFVAARHELDGPLVSVGRAVPILSSNVRAVREVTAVGIRLTNDGRRLVTTVDPDALRIRGGRVPVETIASIAPELDRSARSLRQAQRRIENIDRAYLIGPVGHGLAQLTSGINRAARQTSRAAATTAVVPDMLGAHGPRRYFLAVQNNAELRATGGFIGNYGEIIADNGRLQLGHFGRISDLNGTGTDDRVLHAPEEFLRRYSRFAIAHTWQNVNMSPDFPTVAGVIADLYPQSGGTAVDGVIAVDPAGLGAILKLVGPVTVAGWPDPLTADNIVPVSLRDEYEHFTSQPARVEFLGAVAASVWRAVTTADLPGPDRLGAVLGDAVASKHIMLASTRAHENSLLDRLNISGRVAPVRSDSLLVVNQNAAGNKVDWYLTRHLRLDVHLEPAGSASLTNEPTDVAVQTHLQLELANAAPDHGLATEAIGPFNPQFEPGENRSFVSIYTRQNFDRAAIDGQTTDLESANELGRHVYSAYVSVPSGTKRTLSMHLAGAARLGPGGWYGLDLGHQATVTPDATDVTISLPPGWRIARTAGLTSHRARRAVGHFRAERDRTVWVQIERTGLGRLVGQLRAGR